MATDRAASPDTEAFGRLTRRRSPIPSDSTRKGTALGLTEPLCRAEPTQRMFAAHLQDPLSHSSYG